MCQVFQTVVQCIVGNLRCFIFPAESKQDNISLFKMFSSCQMRMTSAATSRASTWVSVTWPHVSIMFQHFNQHEIRWDG